MMADASQDKRPLSPHLQVYRWQLTAVSSILIRITGVGLAVTLLLVVLWVSAAANDAALFATMNSVLNGFVGRLFLLISLWGIFYHMLGGIRHLIFDLGYGLAMRQATIMGWIMVFGSLVLTVLTVFLLGCMS